MIELTQEELKQRFNDKIFGQISETADALGYQHVEHTFEPVFDEHSKVLILGSFPSVKSREEGFYYGDRKSTRLNSSHMPKSRMPSSA